MPITHTTLCHQVMEALKEDVINNQFMPGQKLHIEKLRQRYGCGATPIREALSQLSGGAFIEAQQQRGFSVRNISLAECHDLFYSLNAITHSLVKRALEKTNTQWTQALQISIKDMEKRITHEKGITREAWQQALRSWHVRLLQQASAPTLITFEKKLFQQIMRYQHVLSSKTAVKISPKLDKVKDLMDAIQTNHTEKAQHAMAQHYQQWQNYLDHRLQSHPNLSAPHLIENPDA